MDADNFKKTVIFQGMSEREISDALEGLNAVTKKYKRARRSSMQALQQSAWDWCWKAA